MVELERRICIFGSIVLIISNNSSAKENSKADYSHAEPLPEEFTWEVPDSLAGERLDRILASHLSDYSRSRLQRWIALGAVRVDGRLCSAKQRLNAGAQIHAIAQPSQAQQAFTPEDISLDVVWENDECLVINKPAGLVTHPGHGNWSGTLMNGLLYHRKACADLPRAGIVHRLDKDTSGLMVVSKTEIAMNSLVKQLSERRVDRRYLALVIGRLAGTQRIDAPIGRDPRDPVRMAVVDPGQGKEAITQIDVIASTDEVSLIQCTLFTGRTHQIRVHMAHLGHSLLGDAVYQTKPLKSQRSVALVSQSLNLQRQALHAWRLAFEISKLGLVRHQISLPSDMQQACQALGFGTALEGLTNSDFEHKLVTTPIKKQ